MPVHAFVFPGQGSQAVGMGRDLAAAFAAARDVFEEVDDALGQRLSRLMFEGTPEELTLTANAQPALMAVSIAALRVAETEGGFRLADRAALVAGHSLGEWTALCAAGALPLGVTARLLRRRGEAMQSAVPAGEGAMAALLGADVERAAALCAEAAASAPEAPDSESTGTRSDQEVVEPANDNGGGQVVVSGHRAAVERAVERAPAHGVRRAMLLPVSAPFHCSLMAPAATVMEQALAETELATPSVPLIANTLAAKATDPDEIRRQLVRQVTRMVRWRESVLAAAEMGIDSFVELGAGRVLAGLCKRILPDARAASAGTPAEIEALLKGL